MGQQELTTLMVKNIPNDYTRSMLLELLDSQGLAGTYDFIYLPADFQRCSSLGYAFLNFVSQAAAEVAKVRLHGFREWRVQSQKICEVRWCEPMQGLAAHIDRYRNSPVMHRSVPDEFKPVTFQNGLRVPFPSPTKRIRKPQPNQSAA